METAFRIPTEAARYTAPCNFADHQGKLCLGNTVRTGGDKILGPMVGLSREPRPVLNDRKCFFLVRLVRINDRMA